MFEEITLEQLKRERYVLKDEAEETLVRIRGQNKRKFDKKKSTACKNI